MSSLVLALALLTSDAAIEADFLNLTTIAAISKLAIALEIMDPRETTYVLARPENWLADIALLRNRYRELSDAPPLRDECRWPDRGLANELMDFNRQYRQYLKDRLLIERVFVQDIHDAIAEAEQLYWIWDTVRDCKCDFYYVSVRRAALKKLREEIGSYAYYNGFFPPHVPTWRFSR